MKTYHHTKIELAQSVAKNDSKHSNQPIWVFYSGIKSVASMKSPDTTIIRVCPHHELPLPDNTYMSIALFHKGKQKTIE